MKTFWEWVEANARLGNVTDHPLYGQAAQQSQRRNAQLGDVTDHPLYGQQSQPQTSPRRNAQLGDVTDHPLYGQQPQAAPAQAAPQPQAATPNPTATPSPQTTVNQAPAQPDQGQRKLDTAQPLQMVVNQYVSALRRRIDQMGPDDPQIDQTLETTYKQLKFKYGQQAADYFMKKAQFMRQNTRQYQSAVG